ncbi:MAG: leucyl/phenylalanyl-tRNA--protein transferase [Proteobacteria bacterium]|nr:leucyl/phenylalanyl-tRNA--protein transferase [Pseudomonadota bacterium]
MTGTDRAGVDITPEVVLKAYSCGIFPMADSAEDPGLYWVEPEWRGVIPLDNFHVPVRLRRTLRADRFEVCCDRDFDAVIARCASPEIDRGRTWINGRIRRLYRALFDIGHCHTVEVYAGDELVGGLYGVSLGAAFFGESMFYARRDASKIALVHLVARLRCGGYQLLDTQFVTAHLQAFGAVEISRRRYQKLLDAALARSGRFPVGEDECALTGAQALALVDAR